MEECLTIYTDGSSAPHPRKGGVGFRMIFPDGRYKDFCPYGYTGANNNQMELQACILALREVVKLESIEKARGVLIYTDSKYVVSNYTRAMFVWSNPFSKQKWTRNDGGPVLNVPQWKELIRLIKRVGTLFHVSVNFEKVLAHSGVEGNEVADKLAKSSRKGIMSPIKISVSKVRRSKTNKQTIIGSIKGEGQRIRIHVVTGSWLEEHKLYRLRCEVLSKKSKYFGNMDFILSETILGAGHIYDVILKEDLNNCRIKKVIKEVIKK